MLCEVVGVYPVDAPEPCHLVELVVTGEGEWDFGFVQQPQAGVPKENWQVAYDEHLLNEEGTSGAPAPFGGPLQIGGSVRLAFFLHYLDPASRILSPAGPISLPPATEKPSRLSFLEYQEP